MKNEAEGYFYHILRTFPHESQESSPAASSVWVVDLDSWQRARILRPPTGASPRRASERGHRGRNVRGRVTGPGSEPTDGVISDVSLA